MWHSRPAGRTSGTLAWGQLTDALRCRQLATWTRGSHPRETVARGDHINRHYGRERPRTHTPKLTGAAATQTHGQPSLKPSPAGSI